MRMPTDYPPYRLPQVPNKQRWLAAGMLFTLCLSSSLALFSHGEDRVMPVVLAAMAILTFIWLWVLRQLWFRCASHNAAFYQQQVDVEHRRWWQQHQQTMAIQDIVLLGPAGCEPGHWQQLLQREQSSPKTDHIAKIFCHDRGDREVRLARQLVSQWCNQRSTGLSVSPCCCYWQGSHNAWQAFVQEAAILLPELILPMRPQPWQGEASLSSAIRQMSDGDAATTLLIGGCHSQPLGHDAQQAGDAAVLWLVAKQGAVHITRGEISRQDEDVGLPDMYLRVLQQSALTSPPDTCILFSLPDNVLPSNGDWSLTHHLQDNNWGEMGALASLVVMSLAAIGSTQQDAPCGWIARDPSGGISTGIVKPYE
ncbi:hypothetical protein [Pantoea phytobeneficialis]|uniref:Type VI secretion protein n=2 Tax=Pantoea phytobeneficialis TaxID=2052056 RepID=A0ABT8Y2Y2_9GAMM|nr:hypothetical protein [Pantoea phytobeneficialis]MDO6410077.1 hypothetical protein [Pantoea phytobeneficialis]